MRDKELIILFIPLFILVGIIFPARIGAEDLKNNIYMDINNGKYLVEKENIVVMDGNSYIRIDEAIRVVGDGPGLDNIINNFHGQNRVIYNNEKKYLGLRELFEGLGYRVEWKDNYKMVFAQNDEFDGLSQEERELIREINKYRTENNLPQFKLSKSLTKVARYHAHDLNKNYDMNNNPMDPRGIRGNMHSWSGKGIWEKVVYTADHNYAKLMWSKPREISTYDGPGYEIVYWNSLKAEPKKALEGWKGSKGHDDIIRARGNWKRLNTMGVAIEGNYAVVWFGDVVDKEGFYSFNKNK